MESQDHKMIHTPGNGSHGVHVCRKCGWTFPNPHPSAKHRRAHKKVCGKIEGFKLIDSEDNFHLSASDDEKLSDEDHKPHEVAKDEEMRNDENSNSGIERKESSRSEEEVFADANTEFSETGTSPAIEIHVIQGVRGTDTCRERISEGDQEITRSVAAMASSDIIQPSKNPIEDFQMQNPQYANCMANQLGSKPHCEGHASSSKISSVSDSQLDTGSELAVGELTDNSNGCPLFFSPMKDEAQSYETCGITSSKLNDRVVDHSWTSNEQNVDAKETETSKDLEWYLKEMASHKPENKETELDSESLVAGSFAYFSAPMKDEALVYTSSGNEGTQPVGNQVDYSMESDGQNVGAKGNEMIIDLEVKTSDKPGNEEPGLDSKSEVTNSTAHFLYPLEDKALVQASCGNTSNLPVECVVDSSVTSDENTSTQPVECVVDSYVTSDEITSTQPTERVVDSYVTSDENTSTQPAEHVVDSSVTSDENTSTQPERVVDSSVTSDENTSTQPAERVVKCYVTSDGQNVVDSYMASDGHNMDAKGNETDKDLEGNLREMTPGKPESVEPELDSNSDVMDSSACFISTVKYETPVYASHGSTKTQPVENLEDYSMVSDGNNVDAKGNETGKDIKGNLGEMTTSKPENVEPELDSNSDVMDCSACLISPVKDEAPVHAYCGSTNTQPGVSLVEHSLATDGHNVDAKEIEMGKDTKGSLLEMKSSKPEHDESKSQLMQSNGAAAEISFDIINSSINIARDSIPLENIDSKSDQLDALEPAVSQNYPHQPCFQSTDIETSEHMGAFFDTQVETSTAQEKNIGFPGTAVEGCRLKGEENGNDPTLSPSFSISEENHPEMASEDHEAQGPMEFEPSETLDCDKAVKESKDCSVNLIPQETQLGEPSCKSCDVAEVSSSAVQLLEDKFQQEDSSKKCLAEGSLVDRNAETSEFSAIKSQGFCSDGLESLPDATGSDVRLGHIENDETAKLTEVLVTREAMISPVFAEVRETTIVDSNEKDGVCDEAMDKNFVSEGAKEEKSTMETSTSLEAKLRIHSLKDISSFEKDLQEVEPKLLETVLDTSGIGDYRSYLESKLEVPSDLNNFQAADVQEASKELDIDSSIDPSPVGSKEIQKRAENIVHKELSPSAVDTEFCEPLSVKDENSSTEALGKGASEIHSETLQDAVDIDNKQVTASAAAPADLSVDSSSQNDSVEGNWGSISDLSARYASDAPPILDTEALSLTNTQGPSKETEKANLKVTSPLKDHRSENTDIFEAPSFMTLVEPCKVDSQKPDSSEIQTAQNSQQPNPSSSQAGWFPSITQVVKESQGRKKNEEIIAKVVNWSPGKMHAPLKSLLIEANQESKQKASSMQGHQTNTTRNNDFVAQDNGPSAKTFPSMSTSLATMPNAGIGNTRNEWNSPARLPDGKRDKRKVKGKTSWVPCVCCSPVN